jgi:hypothetical protein
MNMDKSPTPFVEQAFKEKMEKVFLLIIIAKHTCIVTPCFSV